ncbi:MAG TPA: hypothetical protein DD491_11285 [Halieaceae bacterium]|nr:hypothetical protein [Halieaceae bacterium]
MAKQLQRVFVAGRLRIEDEHPRLDAEAAWKRMSSRYPHLRRAIVHDGTVRGGVLEIPLETPPAKTNG